MGRHNKGVRMKPERFSCRTRHIILLWAESGDDDSDEDAVGKLFIPAVQISLSLSSQEEAASAPSRASADTAVHKKEDERQKPSEAEGDAASL